MRSRYFNHTFLEKWLKNKSKKDRLEKFSVFSR